uniref:DUF5658 domain-containing protein n=1 Tax=Thermofilum pendens TaxID=2269 RepID=A0A7C3WV35_THEPE
MRARDLGFLGALVSMIGAVLDVATTTYALRYVAGAQELNPLGVEVQVARALSNPVTASLWAVVHCLMPFLLFLAADAMARRLKGRAAPLAYLAPVAYGAVAWRAALSNLAIILKGVGG